MLAGGKKDTYIIPNSKAIKYKMVGKDYPWASYGYDGFACTSSENPNKILSVEMFGIKENEELYIFYIDKPLTVEQKSFLRDKKVENHKFYEDMETPDVYPYLLVLRK